MKKIKKIHFVGIKGVGLTPLAIIAKQAKMQVSGSDVAEEYITDAALKEVEITPLVGFNASHVDTADLVITTGAHGGFDNVENIAAKEKNIPVVTKGEAVGMFMDGGIFGKEYDGIAVAGSHGKTTTTGMIATMLKNLRLDPSYVIGTSSITSLGLPGHFGKGSFFVAEADEYALEPQYNKTAQFLSLSPKIIVITNIELEHTDIYPDIDAVRMVFLKFMEKLPADGVVIANGDDKEVIKLKKEWQGRIITYGFSKSNDYTIERVTISGLQTFFWVASKGVSIGEFSVRVPGDHNAMNALAAAVVGFETGLSPEHVKKSLQNYTGAKRRFEFKGVLESGAELYDDYAHHPTEIQKTLEAFKKSFPRKKIVCVFQPHTYSRTKRLFEDFLRSFSNADAVILTDIYSSKREAVDSTISSKQLAFSLTRLHKSVEYLKALPDVLQYLQNQHFDESTVVIIMGAGDIYTVGDQLKKSD